MGRQPNRRPTIFQGGDGLWHCYVTLGTKPNGKLDRRHRQARTATEVAQKVDELLAQTQRGGGIPQKIVTVEQWLTHWVETVVRPQKAHKTYTGYRALITNHIVPNIGAWRLDGHTRRLEPEHLDTMYARLRDLRGADGKRVLADSTILKLHRVLRKALKDATRRGRASRNVADLVDPPTARKRKIAAHTLAETQAIVTAAMDDPMAARWLLGLLLGPRQGEVLGLRWPLVHLDVPDSETPYIELETQLQRRPWRHGCADPVACATEHCRSTCWRLWAHGCSDPARCKGRAHFCPEKRLLRGCGRHKRACPPPCRPDCTGHARLCPQRRDGGLVEVDLKSEGSARVLPLPPVLVQLLRLLQTEQQRLRRLLGQRWDPDGLVFTTDHGRPIDAGADHAAWEALLRRAGVADSRLHALRHTAGTMLVASGTDISVVQELLGHTQVTTTKIYVDVATKVKAEAVDRAVAALMKGDLAALLQRGSATEPA